MIPVSPIQLQNALRIVGHALAGKTLHYDGGDLWTIGEETMRSQEVGPYLLQNQPAGLENPIIASSPLEETPAPLSQP